MGLFLLWWCFDDHLAAAVSQPGLGHLPWWVMLLASLACVPATINIKLEDAA